MLLPFLEERRRARRDCSRGCACCSMRAPHCRRRTWQRLEAVAAQRARRAGVVHHLVGLDRDLAGGHHAHWRLDRAGCIGAADAGHGAQVGSQRREAGDARARRLGVPRLPQRARAHAPGLRRGRLLPDRRRRHAGRRARPERGVVFDGRVAEDFKLTTGTWVSVGTLRVTLVSALAPLCAGRRDHRPRPRRDRRADLSERASQRELPADTVAAKVRARCARCARTAAARRNARRAR